MKSYGYSTWIKVLSAIGILLIRDLIQDNTLAIYSIWWILAIAAAKA